MSQEKIITLKKSKKFKRTELKVEILFFILNYIQNKIFYKNIK